MICRQKLYHFTVANTRFTAPLTRRGKTKFATINDTIFACKSFNHKRFIFLIKIPFISTIKGWNFRPILTPEIRRRNPNCIHKLHAPLPEFCQCKQLYILVSYTVYLLVN